ncbi:molybdenum ABC transporter ATP-binding protein [Pseudomarimonas arenosa]|uniref:Molybdenum ABC transporter ATP-binding protein n=1 Tax=Pseudomarimonas arenosa TaxID=2774145 RepID=A0AAW3ZLK1_9GAMM|nr:molybdenum ABC transporter ATP-binding protein [Pseudomarimonas arenosa]MBD8526340.1 molybdenum ABC transporter ATP-binding protein [Pseudomarimonas arenosa]
MQNPPDNDALLRARLQASLGAFQLDLNLQLPARGISVLFGASGAGKSLALRALAGLEPRVSGDVQFADEVWQRGRHWVPAHRRRIAWLCQRAQLFDHLDVSGNLRFAAGRHAASDSGEVDIGRYAEVCGISHLLSRRVGRLSGGEAQRVALCRALLSRPRYLLLDEPLSALDSAARLALCQLLRRLASDEALPMLLVTHSLDEVERVADQVIVLTAGRNQPRLSLAEAMAAPDIGLQAPGELAAVFDLEASAQQDEPDLLRLQIGQDAIHIPWRGPRPDRAVRLRIAARDVTLWPQLPPLSSAQNCLPLQVERIVDGTNPAMRLVIGRCRDGRRLFARITRAAERQLQLTAGQSVFAQFKAVALL